MTTKTCPRCEAPVFHQQLSEASALDAWEPLDGYAILTCKIRIRSGAYDAWETCMYEFLRTQGGWIIDTQSGCLKYANWSQVVDWFRGIHPIEIDLLTTV